MVGCGGLFAQQSHIALYVNPDIDTSNVEISQVIHLWDNYLNAHPDSAFDNPYWLASEKQRYPKCWIQRGSATILSKTSLGVK